MTPWRSAVRRARPTEAIHPFFDTETTTAYQDLRRTTEYRWERQDRLGRRPALQYVGPGAETIDLDGIVYPHFRGGLGQIDAMRIEAGKGEPLLMVDGLGFVHDRWCIMPVTEGQRDFFSDGAPRAQTFELALEAYGEDGA